MSLENFNPDKLRQLLEDSGRTRAWVAEQAEIKVNTLSRYVSGFSSPSKPVAKLIAIALECEISDFQTQVAA